MKLTKEWVENELKHSEALENHRPPDEEYAFYCAVRDGDMEYVQKNCTAEVFSNPTGMGVLAKDPLQNLKYHFVITAALVTRYCITGGMAAEQGYRLSDFYINRADACTDINAVVELHHAMVQDFTGKMRLKRRRMSSPNQCHSVWITSMTISTSASPYRHSPAIRGCRSATFPACSSRISAYP